MFRLFKKKYVYPELKWPPYARELTEYEKRFVVNGGGAMTPQHQAELAEAYRTGDQGKVDDIMSHYQNSGSGTTTTTPPSTTGTTPTTTTPPASVPPTPPANGSEEPNNTTPPGSSGNGGSGSSGGGSGTGGSSGSGSGSGSGGNSSPSSTNSTTTSQYKPSVSEQERYLKAGLSHVEDYKKAARKTLGIKGSSVTGSSFKSKEVSVEAAQNVTLTGRNLTGRGFPSSTDGFRPVEVKSGSPGSLARKGYPSTTEGYPNAYNTIEKKPLMGEDIYSEYYIRKNVPEQYQEAAIRAMHEEEKRGLYGSPTDSKRMTWPVGDPTELQDCHTGVDVGALVPGVKGDPIYATADGKVVSNTFTKSNSSLVAITLPNSRDLAVFQHAKFIVKVGDEVKRGQVIGYMDDVGPDWMTTHLHYEIRHNGIYALNKDGVLIDPTLLVDPTLHMPGTYYFDKALGTI